jgi:hypothetical protein
MGFWGGNKSEGVKLWWLGKVGNVETFENV